MCTFSICYLVRESKALQLFLAISPWYTDVLGIHLRTKQKMYRVSKMQTLPKYRLAFYHLKLKSDHFYCWHLTDKNPVSWEVCIWRNETSWQIHHNLAMLFCSFWLIVPKWSSAVTHREKETRRYWILPPSLYLSLPRKKRKETCIQEKPAILFLHFLHQFGNGVK